MLSLALQHVAREQLTLGVRQVDEVGADFEIAIGQRIALRDSGAQHQAGSLGHQHHLDRQLLAHCKTLLRIELNPAFGQFDRLRRTQLAQCGVGNHLPEQVDALAQRLEKAVQHPVALVQLAHQML